MSWIKSFLKKFCYAVSPKKYIIFESVPDVGDNSKAVFDEMIRRGVNKKYTLVWLLGKSYNQYPEIRNVKYVKKDDPYRKWYITAARCFICCNAFVYSNNPKQKAFFLTHGMYVKCPTAYYTLPKEIQYCLSSSCCLALLFIRSCCNTS